MLCPKCEFDNPQDSQTCARCGVIFAKIQEREELLQVESQDEKIQISESISLQDLLLSGAEEVSSWLVYGRIVLLLGALIWGGQLVFSSIASNAVGSSLLHNVNLPFHEAGHLVFRPFGAFMTSLGGTLGQLLIPLICSVVLLLKTRDPFGAAICFWWFGENLLDIAPYINDASVGQLPLLGGNTGHSSPYGFHDWEFLLTESGLLRFDHAIAKFSHGFGSLLMVLAIVWASIVLYRQFNRRV